MGSIDRRLRNLERDWGGGDEVRLEQLDGSVRAFPPHECWAAAFSACMSLSFKKPEGAVFDALRDATDDSREFFEQEFGEINTAIVGRNEEGIWAEVYEYDLVSGEVECTYYEPGSEDAQAVFDSAKDKGTV
jgi:hypothetical protein